MLACSPRGATAPILGLAAALAMANPARAGITEINITSVEPFAGGMPFGEAGPYVRMVGVAKGEVDPKAPHNAVIVNLDKAPVNARGMVEYETEVFILRPAEPASGARKILYDVTNRGRKFLLQWIDEAPTAAAISDPRKAEDAGIAFSLKRGYTIVWSGWDPDTPAGFMRARLPVARENGRDIVQRIRNEIVVATRGPADVEISTLPYEASSTDKVKARLTVREREADARRDIEAEGWEFASAKGIRLLPQGTRFVPGKLYEFWYEAKNPTVLGLGYAATRDLVSFLRHEAKDRAGNANPVAIAGTPGSGITHAMAIGISQSGRYLRHHIELGMNGDEQGRRVFDGVLAHISGIGKVFANHAFGQPGRTATQHEDRFYPENWFPFAYAASTDPFSGRTAALMPGAATDPFVIETNTSTEYWQKGASLVHTDPAGRHDLVENPRTRTFLIAGTQHGGRAGLDDKRGLCANPKNPHNPGPALRALIMALDEWVSRGIEPPASRVPSIAAGTAVAATGLAFPAIPGATLAKAGNVVTPPTDWVDPQPPAQAYGALVSGVDADGNELAGIRLPTIAVPLATYTGWNLYQAAEINGELCDRDGSFWPFAKTRAERDATGDPRPSLEERYGSRQAYVDKVRATAQALQRDRLLLPEDANAFVKAAEAMPGLR